MTNGASTSSSSTDGLNSSHHDLAIDLANSDGDPAWRHVEVQRALVVALFVSCVMPLNSILAYMRRNNIY